MPPAPHAGAHTKARFVRKNQLLISQLFRLLSLEFFCDSFHDAA
jgi:hypothetical protein